MATTTYKINGKNVQFDVDEYLKNSSNVQRKDMPQVNMDSFLKNLPQIKKHVGVVKTKLRADHLYPTQNEINMEKVLRNVQTRGALPQKYKTFIVSQGLNIIDGHHRHVQCLIENPKQMLDVYLIDIPTSKLLDMFRGMKTILNKPRAIHELMVEVLDKELEEELGMGDVEFGQPATADSEGEKGSGDLMSTQKKKKKDPTYAEMKPALEWVKEIFDIDLSYLYEKLEILESVTVNKEGVIESEDGIEWMECVNLPVSRKYLKMEKEFKVKTMEGITEGKAGDYLMRGVDGEMYPCDADIFHKTYTHLDKVGDK